MCHLQGWVSSRCLHSECGQDRGGHLQTWLPKTLFPRRRHAGLQGLDHRRRVEKRFAVLHSSRNLGLGANDKLGLGRLICQLGRHR